MSILERLTGRRRRKAAEPIAPYPPSPQEAEAMEAQLRTAMENARLGCGQFYQVSPPQTWWTGPAAPRVDFPPAPADACPRVTSAALRDAARRLVALSRDCPDGVAYELRLLATLVVAPAAEDAEEREARERGEKS